MLRGPVQWQIDFGQSRRGEFEGLATLHDRLDQLRAQKSKIDEAPDVAPGYAVTSGEFLQRPSSPGGQLLKPRAPAGDLASGLKTLSCLMSASMKRGSSFRALAALRIACLYGAG